MKKFNGNLPEKILLATFIICQAPGNGNGNGTPYLGADHMP